MKPNGCIKLFRKELKWLNELTGTEFKVYINLRCIADWDSRHENFGAARISLRELKKVIGKAPSSLSAAIKGLITKGLAERPPGRGICLKDFVIYQQPVRRAERLLQLKERGVQINEQTVRNLENLNFREFEIQKQKLSEKWRIPPI